MAILINVQLSAETLVEECEQINNELIEMKSVLKEGHDGVRMWS